MLVRLMGWMDRQLINLTHSELSQLSLDESPADTEGKKATEKDVERIFRKTFLSTKVRGEI